MYIIPSEVSTQACTAYCVSFFTDISYSVLRPKIYRQSLVKIKIYIIKT